MTPPLLTWDIGGTHVTAAVVQGNRIDGRVTRPVDNLAPAAEILTAWAQAGVEAARHWPAALAGGSLGMPGPFDYARGVSRHETKFLHLRDLDVRAALTAQLNAAGLPGLPLTFTNDAACFTLGESRSGDRQGATRLVGVTLGTGVGSGFVADGQVVSDGDQVPPDGQIWWTPYRDGVAEDYIGTRALTDAYCRRSGERCTPLEIARRARRADSQARDVYAAMGRALGEILTPWLQRFQATGLVLGGNISRSRELFSAPLRQQLPPGLALHFSRLGEDAALLGAALAWQAQHRPTSPSLSP